MEALWSDVKFGVRMLLRSPGFAIVAILTLALGIGANTALFSLVNGILLAPLRFPQADRLVALYQHKPEFKYSSISYAVFCLKKQKTRNYARRVFHRDIV